MKGDAQTGAMRIHNLTVAYDGVTALSRLDLDVLPGETVVLFGPSGCGKSSALRALAGLLKPVEGTIEVDGELVVGPSAERAMVFQEDALLPWRSAAANVEFALALQGVDRRRRHIEARELLKRVGLVGFDNHLPRQLSGGMRQRVQLARTLATRPRVMLMDEPFGALDAQTRQVMQNLLLDVWREHHTTSVFVTHDLNEALFLGDRVCVLTSRPARVEAIVTIAGDREGEARSRTQGAVSQARSDILAAVSDAHAGAH